jgi:ataxin-3
MQKYIYHEQQESALCGQHCLNNLLQGPYFTAVDLANIAEELDEQERALGNQESLRSSANVDDSGNFSIQVLRSALQRYNGIDLRVWFQKSGSVDIEPSEQKAFIVNRSEHWIAIRKIHGKWWNLNSTNALPELVSDFYLSALLLQLREDGFTVFISDGDVPICSDPQGSGLYAGRGTGTWHLESYLLGTGSTAGSHGSGFQAFQGKGNRLGGSSSSDVGLEVGYDEDLQLARAIAASLEVPSSSTTSTEKNDMRAKRLAALSKMGIS